MNKLLTLALALAFTTGMSLYAQSGSGTAPRGNPVPNTQSGTMDQSGNGAATTSDQTQSGSSMGQSGNTGTQDNSMSQSGTTTDQNGNTVTHKKHKKHHKTHAGDMSTGNNMDQSTTDTVGPTGNSSGSKDTGKGSLPTNGSASDRP